MGTFRQRNTDLEPSILVGWAAGLLRAWPDETTEPIEADGFGGTGSSEADRPADVEHSCLLALIAS
jgi:hypothetical protein